MTHWRSRPPPAPSTFALSLLLALAAAMTAPILLLGLKLLRKI